MLWLDIGWLSFDVHLMTYYGVMDIGMEIGVLVECLTSRLSLDGWNTLDDQVRDKCSGISRDD